MDREYKVGEIFEHDGKVFQCVEDSTGGCFIRMWILLCVARGLRSVLLHGLREAG